MNSTGSGLLANAGRPVPELLRTKLTAVFGCPPSKLVAWLADRPVLTEPTADIAVSLTRS